MAGGDHLKKAQSGQPLRIPAQTFNSFVDAARDFQLRQQSQTTGSSRSFRQTGIVLVRNDSGADRERFHILGIDGPVISPDDNLDEFQNRVVLKGKKPKHDDHLGRFVVLLEPVRQNQIGLAYCDGVCPAKIDVEDEDHEFADIKDDDATALESRDDGSAVILWKEAGEGQKWAVVQLGRRTTPWYWGDLTGDLKYGESAEVTLLKQDPDDGSLLESTNRKVDAWCPILEENYKLPSGARVKVEVLPQSGLWNVTASNKCPEKYEEEEPPPYEPPLE